MSALNGSLCVRQLLCLSVCPAGEVGEHLPRMKPLCKHTLMPLSCSSQMSLNLIKNIIRATDAAEAREAMMDTGKRCRGWMTAAVFRK